MRMCLLFIAMCALNVLSIKATYLLTYLCEWTAVRVASQEDVCSPKPCLNSGQCSVRPIGEITASSPLPYSCTCFGGFWGINCTQFDPCSKSDACLNGGTCHNTSSVTYTCDCPAGFYGDRCEVR